MLFHLRLHCKQTGAENQEGKGLLKKECFRKWGVRDAQTVQNFAIRSRSNRKFNLNLEFLLANRPRKEVYYKRKCSYFSGWEAGHHKQQCARRCWERMELVSQTTKRALEASLKKLLLQKPLNKITINDITEDCGVNRMTFYYHFKDIYDLVDWILVEDAAEALEGRQNFETWSEALLDALQRIQDNRVLVLNVYRSVSREQVEQYLYKMLDPLLRMFVERENIPVQEEDKQFIIDFYKYALVGMVLEWIRRDMKTEPAIMAERLNIMMHGDLKRALLRFSTDGRASKIDD